MTITPNFNAVNLLTFADGGSILDQVGGGEPSSFRLLHRLKDEADGAFELLTGPEDAVGKTHAHVET